MGVVNRRSLHTDCTLTSRWSELVRSPLASYWRARHPFSTANDLQLGKLKLPRKTLAELLSAARKDRTYCHRTQRSPAKSRATYSVTCRAGAAENESIQTCHDPVGTWLGAALAHSRRLTCAKAAGLPELATPILPNSTDSLLTPVRSPYRRRIASRLINPQSSPLGHLTNSLVLEEHLDFHCLGAGLVQQCAAIGTCCQRLIQLGGDRVVAIRRFIPPVRQGLSALPFSRDDGTSVVPVAVTAPYSEAAWVRNESSVAGNVAGVSDSQCPELAQAGTDNPVERSDHSADRPLPERVSGTSCHDLSSRDKKNRDRLQRPIFGSVDRDPQNVTSKHPKT